MAGQLAAQTDILLFFALFSCVLCGVECVVLNREDGPARRWRAFLSFYSFQAAAFGVRLASGVLEAGSVGAILSSFFQNLSMGSLFILAPLSPIGQQGRRGFAILGFGLVAACTAIELGFGGNVGGLSAGLALALPGAFFAIRFLAHDPGLRSPGRPWLIAHAAIFGMLALLAFLAGVLRLVRPGMYDDQTLLARAALTLLLALTLSLHEVRTFGRLNWGYGRPLTRFSAHSAILSLPLLVVVGVLAAISMGHRAERELRSQYENETQILLNAVEARTGEADRDASILADSFSMQIFIAVRNEQTRRPAQKALDDVAAEIHGACYLLDRKGATLASSRGAADFHEARGGTAAWFTEAIDGGSSRGFTAFGARADWQYRASTPVWSITNDLVGMIVIVCDISSLFRPMRPGGSVFLVDANGVATFSSEEGLAPRLLWPVSAELRKEIAASDIAADVSYDPLFPSKPESGSIVRWHGAFSYATRLFLSIPGWSILTLGSNVEVFAYRLTGLLATIAIVLVLLMFTATSRMTLLDEARIERSESLYRTLVEGAPEWISIVDDSGRFLFTNTAGRKSFGLGGDGAGDASMETLIGAARVKEMANAVGRAAAEGIASAEMALAAASGETKIWHLVFVPMHKGGRGAAAILIGSDITVMRAAEARLVRAERMAALGTLAAGVAHQFNNINTVAMLQLQILLADPGLSREARENAAGLEGALQRSVDITTRLLPLSAAGHGPEARSSLASVVREVLVPLRHDIEREGVTLELDLAQDPRVPLGHEQLAFVVKALLVNALHAVIEQPLRRITVRTSVDAGQATYEVRDTGIGIAPEKMSSLFTPFFSEKGEHAPPGSPQARVRGVGLSLSVAHPIVTSAGGRIDVWSVPREATLFTVRLPCTPEKE